MTSSKPAPQPRLGKGYFVTSSGRAIIVEITEAWTKERIEKYHDCKFLYFQADASVVSAPYYLETVRT